MEISKRTQVNCSEWNDEVEEDYPVVTTESAQALEDLKRIISSAKKIKDWDA